MDWGDLIAFVLDLFVDVDCLRFWRFCLGVAAGLGLAALLDVLGFLAGPFLYLLLGPAGAFLGLLWEVSHRRG